MEYALKQEVQHPIQALCEASVIVAAVATIPIVILEENGSSASWLVLAEWIIWSLFVFDFAVDLRFSGDRRHRVRTHLLDLTIVVLSFPLLPAALALTRLVRLVRAFRVVRLVRIAGVTLRAVPALKATLARHELIYVASVSGLLILAGGSLMTVIEPETVKGNLQNAIWWAVVTASTVGYGDISPTTPVGRLVAIFMMLAGIGLISTLSASIAAYFVDQGSESALREIQERLERIETALKVQRSERPSKEDQPSMSAKSGGQ
jgi:voltage-gated potassium channel